MPLCGFVNAQMTQKPFFLGAGAKNDSAGGTGASFQTHTAVRHLAVLQIETERGYGQLREKMGHGEWDRKTKKKQARHTPPLRVADHHFNHYTKIAKIPFKKISIRFIAKNKNKTHFTHHAPRPTHNSCIAPDIGFETLGLNWHNHVVNTWHVQWKWCMFRESGSKWQVKTR